MIYDRFTIQIGALHTKDQLAVSGSLAAVKGLYGFFVKKIGP